MMNELIKRIEKYRLEITDKNKEKIELKKIIVQFQRNKKLERILLFNIIIS